MTRETNKLLNGAMVDNEVLLTHRLGLEKRLKTTDPSDTWTNLDRERSEQISGTRFYTTDTRIAPQKGNSVEFGVEVGRVQILDKRFNHLRQQ